MLSFPRKSICICISAGHVHATQAFMPPCNLQSSAGDDGDDDASGASYQLDMMRCLREVNVDNNTVGW